MLQRRQYIVLLLVALVACQDKPKQVEGLTLEEAASQLDPSHYWESVWGSGSNDV